MKILYSTTATASGGRAGSVATSDGRLDLKLSVPKEMNGDGGPGTNPEQLFAAGYAACFESATRITAQKMGLSPSKVQVTATVGIGPRAEGGFGLAVTLDVALAGVTREEGEGLAQAVHSNVCPYSNAIRGNVDVTLNVAVS